MMSTTDDGRTILKPRGGEEPRSAKSNWQLWKLCKELKADEIAVLITKRKMELKYLDKDKDREDIRRIRSEILLLEDAYRILKRCEA